MKFDFGLRQLFMLFLLEFDIETVVDELLTRTSLLQERRRDDKPSSCVLPYVSQV